MNIHHNEEEKETVKGLTVGQLKEYLEKLCPTEEDDNKVVFIKNGGIWSTIKEIYLDQEDGQVLLEGGRL